MRKPALVVLVTALCACRGGDAAPPPPIAADLVIYNGRVWTGVEGAPIAEAIAIVGDRIAAIGSGRDISPWVNIDTRSIDANSGLVVPGFIDSHSHLVDGGFALSSVQLRDAATPEELVARIAAFAATIEPGRWITRGDWNNEEWGGELPTRAWIDSVTPHHPVWVNRLDGQMALANSLALDLAGVTASTPDVVGGTIVRDASGAPTGLLRNDAMTAVSRVVPAPPADVVDRAVDAAMAHVAARGITTVHNMGSWSDLEALRRARDDGRATTRVYAAVPLASWARLRDTVQSQGKGDDWLHIGALKGYVDGSLGSHTAAFHEPFADAPDHTGVLVTSPDDLYQWTAAADSAGLHVIVHAIGDRANALQLDVFERVARENGPRDRRFRIEHAQHVAPRDLGRFGEIGVIASMHPFHAIDDGRWAERVIGPERIQTSYAFRSLLDGGATLAFGSDWSVAPASPLEGIYAAVTRETLDGANPGGWVPEQKITVEEALAAYTRNAAYAGFEDDRVGTLEPGKLADITIIDLDLLRVRPERIRQAQVTHTVVGGRIVHAPRDP